MKVIVNFHGEPPWRIWRICGKRPFPDPWETHSTGPHPQTGRRGHPTHPNTSQTHPSTSLILMSDLLSRSEAPFPLWLPLWRIWHICGKRPFCDPWETHSTHPHPQTGRRGLWCHPNTSQTHPSTSLILKSDLLSRSEAPQSALPTMAHMAHKPQSHSPQSRSGTKTIFSPIILTFWTLVIGDKNVRNTPNLPNPGGISHIGPQLAEKAQKREKSRKNVSLVPRYR